MTLELPPEIVADLDLALDLMIGWSEAKAFITRDGARQVLALRFLADTARAAAAIGAESQEEMKAP